MIFEPSTISSLMDFVDSKILDLSNRYIKEFGINGDFKYKNIILKNDSIKHNHFAIYINGSLYSLIPHMHSYLLKKQIIDFISKYGWSSCYYLSH